MNTKKQIINRVIASLALLLLVNMSAIGQTTDLNKAIPRDPSIRKGVLSNGMTYYIKHNEEPKQRASFYIIQNVGALLENDDQNGLAHFLEHMAFNGTQHFPGKGVIKGLEQYGVKFGQNLNAYTSYNETVYNISDVPTNNEKAMDMGLMVLKDWSHYLTLDGDEIDSERGVISEEWRTRRNSEYRMRLKYMPVILKDSKWAVRDVIGSLDIINNFEHQTIKDFYHNWYRTDLQCIAIVGDFDVDKMEKKVIEQLSTIPAIENPKPRPTFTVPDHKEINFVLATDKEATKTSVSYYSLKPSSKYNTQAYIRELYLNKLWNSMMSSRFSDLFQSQVNAATGGSAGYYNYVRGYDFARVSADAKNNHDAEAFKIVYTELERVKRFGFLQSELDRAITTYSSAIERSYKSRNNTSNDSYAKLIKDDFLKEKIVASPEFNHKLGVEIMQSITLSDINALAKKWFNNENVTIVIKGPENVEHATKEDILNTISQVEKSTLKPYVDNSANLVLLNKDEVKGGKIVKTKDLKKFDATEWTLSNGAKVIFRHADFNKNYVSLYSWSPGGTSLYDNDKILQASNCSRFTSKYGFGDLSNSQLRKVMAGKKVGVSAYISSLKEGFSGSSTSKDFESMLQVLYLKFEKPRFDKAAFDIEIARERENIKASLNNPQKILRDSLRMIFLDHNPRIILKDEHYADKINFDEMNEIYKDRFSDASDFTFIIVGDISKEEAKPLVEKYIGALTDIKRKENWVDRKVRGPKGVTERKLYISQTTPKGTVIVRYSKYMKATPKNRIYMGVIKSVLDLRFTTEIREKEGGTYGVSVSSSAKKLPKEELSLSLQFDSKPEKAEYLKKRVYEVIDDFIQNGPTQNELDKIKANLLKNREQSKHSNNYWMGILKTYMQENEDMSLSKNYEDIVNNLTQKDIIKMSHKFFKNADKVDVEVLPKK